MDYEQNEINSTLDIESFLEINHLLIDKFPNHVLKLAVSMFKQSCEDDSRRAAFMEV